MWLLASAIKHAIELAYSQGLAPTAEQQMQYEASLPARADLRVSSSGTAVIEVTGVLTQRPSFIMRMFGGGNTTYGEIINALADIEANPDFDSVEMRVDSGGGEVNGLFEMLAAMEAFSKPIKAVVSGQAASAAYALVSQADEIVATNKGASFGSIGVVVQMFADPDMVTITNTESEAKRPDITTEEGQAVVREQLDATYELFAESIASGRATTVEKINADFGNGRMFLAEEALKRGMIDSVVTSVTSSTSADSLTTASVGGDLDQLEKPMDLETLKVQHADVYRAAVAEGVSQERDRVSSHIILGEASGALETAITAVKDGTEMTETLRSTYQAASMKHNENLSAISDDADLDEALKGAKQSAATEADKVCALVENALGVGR